MFNKQDKYKSLFDDAPDALIVNDSNGVIIEVNNKGLELMGYTREELVGKHFTDVVPKETMELAAEAFRQVLMQGSAELIQAVLERKDGTAVTVEINGCVVDYDGGKAVLGIFRDIGSRA